MVTQPSLVTEHPVSYLLAEATRYFIDQEKVQNESKREWLARMKSEGADNQSELALSERLFGESNAETRLELMGYRVGLTLAERLSRDLPRLPGELEVVKFICKEFWSSVFGKQVDNLRTNHQGIYVIQDNKFSLITAFSSGTQYLDQVVQFLAMPAGTLRGALASFGLNTVVVPSVETVPIVRFNITIQAAEDPKSENSMPA